MNRRSLLRAGALAMIGGPLVAVTGCGSQSFLSPLSVSLSTITPDGQGLHDESNISYTLTKRADVSVSLVGPDGKSYELRPWQTRTPDDYQIQFKGLVPVPGKFGHDWLRVVPDGAYRIVVQARDAAGQMVRRETTITVKNADTSSPDITNVTVQYAIITPNGDGDRDATTVGYKLTKKSLVRVYATNSAGAFFLVQASKKTEASLQSFTWSGTRNGNEVLPDGKYDLHIEATDAAGNFTDYVTQVAIQNGGTPQAEIVDAKFSPTAIAVGGDIHVTMVVRNTGTVPIKTLGPPSGSKYTTEQTFATQHNPDGVPTFFERAGVWRVAVGWQNQAQPFPLRWGFFGPEFMKNDGSGTFTKDLQPGEEVTVTGTITIGPDMKQINAQRFFAGLERGGVGFPGGQVGQTTITIGF